VATDKRFRWAYIFAAARPGTDDAFALVMPQVSTQAMMVFLAAFAASLPAGVHAVLDRTGWHVAKRLSVPANVSLIHLPPYSPELNPVERIWFYLRERWLSHRLFADEDAIVEGCCRAWRSLIAETGRLSTLTNYPYLLRVRTN
jgi:transposase